MLSLVVNVGMNLHSTASGSDESYALTLEPCFLIPMRRMKEFALEISQPLNRRPFLFVQLHLHQ